MHFYNFNTVLCIFILNIIYKISIKYFYLLILIKKYLKIVTLFFKLVFNMTHRIKYRASVVDLVYNELNFNVTNYNFSKPDLLPLIYFINTVFG